MLKAVIDSLDGLDEAIAALYTEQDGKFVLDLDGVQDHPGTAGLKTSQDKLKREKQNATAKNTKLQEEVDGLKQQMSAFDGVDIDELRDLAEKMGADEDLKLIKEGKLDEVVDKRTERLVKKKDEAIAKAETERDEEKVAKEAAETKLQKKVVEGAIQAAALKLGVVGPAVPDVVTRGNAVFSVDDNMEPVQLDAEGEPVIGPDGKTNLTPEAWLEGMKTDAPHWFPTSAGGGAQGGDEGRQSETDPFDRKAGTWNLTEQSLLAKSDRPKYDRLRAKHGLQPLNAGA